MSTDIIGRADLSEPQRKVLEYIEDYYSEHGFSPSLNEIAEEFEYRSTFGVRKHIAALTKKGFLVTFGQRLFRALVPTRSCRICGCTDRRACPTGEGPCSWIERELCSGCSGRDASEDGSDAAGQDPAAGI